MPDAITLIEQDHRTVEDLFEQFESSEGDIAIAREICRELTVHADMEEQLFYPRVRQRVSEDLADEALHEHQQARELIREIQGLSEDDLDELEELMSDLKADVEHHVEEEESEILPRARDEFGDQLEALGEEIAQFKEEHGGTLDLSKEELYEQAKERDIPRRSKMDKEELAEVLEES